MSPSDSETNPFYRDATPLDTDWNSIGEMLADIRAFCKANPSHELLPADDPGTNYKPWRVARIGFCAFRNVTPEFCHENIRRDGRGEKMLDWDEQQKNWTITLGKVRSSQEDGDVPMTVLHTAQGRLALSIFLRTGESLDEILARLQRVSAEQAAASSRNGAPGDADSRRSNRPPGPGPSSSSGPMRAGLAAARKTVARWWRALFGD
jgi:hypothetical protein